MTAIKEYLAPRTLDEVTRLASETGATLLAGGTDLVPRWSKGIVEKPATIVDVKAVDQLRGVKRVGGEVSVGACTLMSELETDPIIRAAAPMLAKAAGRIACPQIRNRATLGGNLCNASPAADTAVPLILLDAVVELASRSPNATSSAGGGGCAVREVRITDFFNGPGSTVLAPGEILTRVRFKPIEKGSFWAWDKFGTRPAMEIAVASVGVLLTWESGVIARARVAYGSVAPVPLRGREAEVQLIEQHLSSPARAESNGPIKRCVAAALEEIAPISDVRASEGYRREIVGVMLRRMLVTSRTREAGGS